MSMTFLHALLAGLALAAGVLVNTLAVHLLLGNTLVTRGQRTFTRGVLLFGLTLIVGATVALA